MAVVLWNRGSSRATITAQWPYIGIVSPSAIVKARDLWAVSIGYMLLFYDLNIFQMLLEIFTELHVLDSCSACGYWQSSRANHRYGGLSCLQDVHSDTAVEHCARCHVRLGVGAQRCRSPFLSHIS